mgnify:CR=1 FL=1
MAPDDGRVSERRQDVRQAAGWRGMVRAMGDRVGEIGE